MNRNQNHYQTPHLHVHRDPLGQLVLFDDHKLCAPVRDAGDRKVLGGTGAHAANRSAKRPHPDFQDGDGDTLQKRPAIMKPALRIASKFERRALPCRQLVLTSGQMQVFGVLGSAHHPALRAVVHPALRAVVHSLQLHPILPPSKVVRTTSLWPQCQRASWCRTGAPARPTDAQTAGTVWLLLKAVILPAPSLIPYQPPKNALDRP